MDMTLNGIIKKLIKNNKGQYGILMGSIIFAVMMIGSYGLIQFSPTVTEVLVAGGSTMMITLTMFLFTVIGTFAFVIYAHSLFLKYKSKEIGVFISLGIKRSHVKEIVVKELTIVVLIATLIGLVLSVPLSFLSWSALTAFLDTAETVYRIGWLGLIIAVLFSIIAMAMMIWTTNKYIKKVDIINILKATEEVEDVKGDKYILGLIGAILIPFGIIMFNIAAVSNGLLGKITFLFLVLSLVGLYLVIVQITSLGTIVKKISPKAYYKNIIFFNLVKQKGKQYTKTLFVTTILVGVTIFGVSFNAAPMIEGFLTNLNGPYDFSVPVGFQQNGFGESEIRALADEYNLELKDFKTFDSLLVGLYDEDPDWRGSVNFISESQFNQISGENIDVKEGTYVEFISMDSRHGFGDSEAYDVRFFNGTTQEIFTLKQVDLIQKPGILAGDYRYGSTLSVLDDREYEKLSETLEDEFKGSCFIFNVDNWRETEEFSDKLFSEIVKASGNKWCSNYNYSPLYELNKKEDNGREMGYEFEELNESTELMAKKWWDFTPYSRYHRHFNTISDFAIYILLLLYIAVIAFMSSIMVVGIKILNTMWQDKGIYKNVTFLGMKKKEIESIVTKQVMLIYFTPLALGTLITLFLLREMLKVTGIVYMQEAFLASCGVASIVIIIQVIVFFFIRKKALKECIDFENI